MKDRVVDQFINQDEKLSAKRVKGSLKRTHKERGEDRELYSKTRQARALVVSPSNEGSSRSVSLSLKCEAFYPFETEVILSRTLTWVSAELRYALLKG